MQITNKQIEYCKLCDDIKRQHRKRSVFFWALPKWVGDWNLRWGKLPVPSQRAQKSTGNTNPKLRWLFKHLSYEKYVLQSVRISAKVGRGGSYFGNALDIFLGWGSRIRDNRIRMFLDACLEKKKKNGLCPRPLLREAMLWIFLENYNRNFRSIFWFSLSFVLLQHHHCKSEQGTQLMKQTNKKWSQTQLSYEGAFSLPCTS